MLQQAIYFSMIKSKSRYRLVRTVFFLFALCSFAVIGNSQITGDQDVCAGETEMYSISIPGAVSYLWTTVDGQIAGADNQSNVFVTWQVASSGASVNVAVTNSSNVTSNYNLNVSVNDNPNPIIVSEFESGCIDNPGKEDHQGGDRPPEIDDECLKACEDTKIKYYIAFDDPNSVYSWNVFGGVISSQNSNGSVIYVTWNSPAGSSGLLQVTETTINGCEGMAERCVDIIDVPKAIFDIEPQAPQYCLDQDIFFMNQSLGNNLSYLWDFGDGETSIDENPVHQFDTEGIYVVWLKAYNECGCVDSIKQEIKIIDEPAPEIECISTVCANDISYYALTNVCPNYTSLVWSVTGGSILSGQGTLSPEIKWADVPVGILEVEVDGCACSTTARAEIPIISDNLSIDGPMSICVEEEAMFSIPCQPGRVMTWSAPGGDIVSRNPHDHEVLIQYNTPGTYFIKVTLSENAALKCGRDELEIVYEVKVVPKAIITPGDDEFCEGDSQNFTVSYAGGGCMGSNPFDWQIFDGTGSAVTGVTSTCTYTLPSNLPPGNYELVANLDPSDYKVCNHEVSHYFVVHPKPPVPQFGTGELIVCPNEAFEYTAIPDMGNIIEWTIVGGNSGGATLRTGNEISVVWTSLPGTLEIRQYSSDGLGCTSDPILVIVEEIDPLLFDIGGINSTCAINQVAFPFTTGVPATSYNWKLVPEELGSIVSGQFTNEVEVVFQSPSNLVFPTSVDLVLEAVVCGNPITYSHTIALEALDISLNLPTGPLCEGDFMTVSATSNLAGYNTHYNWYVNGVLQPGNAATNTLNTAGLNGTLSITVEGIVNDPGSACDGSTSTDAGQIVVLSAPDVTIPNLVHLCGNDPMIISATQQSIPGGGTGFYNYTWLDPTNTPITPSPNAAAITLDPNTALTGVYTVVITDPVNGCSITESIVMDNQCDPLPPCPANNSFSWSVDCQTATLVPSIGTGTFVQWIYGDGSTGVSNTHFYNRPANYGVTMEVLLPGGNTCYVIETVPVLMRPDFESHFGCGPSGTRSVQFYDRTEYLNGLPGSFTYNWNISGVGTMTGSNPIMNLAPGTYTVDLTINYSGAPYSTSCIVTKTIVVPDVVGVSLPSNITVCEGNPVSFTSAGSGPIVSSFWDFGDGSVSFDSSPSKTYDEVASNTNFTVTYTAMDDYGCLETGSTIVTVLNNSLEGNVSIVPGVTTAACDQLTLSANGPGVITGYDWINVYDPSVSIGTSQNQVITSSGVYGVELINGQGCRAFIESEPMIIYPSPDPIYSGEIEYCVGETIELNAMLGSDYDYEWVLGGTTTGPSFTTVINTPGTYTLQFTITDNNVMNPPGSCSTTVPIELTVHPNPTVSIVEPFVCAPGLANVSSPNPNYIYSWSNGDIGPVANVLYETAIEVTATDQNGCEAKHLVEVSEGPDFCNTMVGCYNFCEGNPQLNWLGPVGPNQTPPFYTYQWLVMDPNGVFNPVPGETGPTFPFGISGYGSGFYQVEVTDEFGCVDTSGIIDIDISEECVCDVEVKEVKLMCTGEFDQNGNPIYDITITLVNSGLGISGWNIQTNGGTLMNIMPSSIPGGTPSNPTLTHLTGQYIWDGNVNSLYALFTGFNLNTGEECRFDFDVEIPSCNTEPCDFEIKPLEPKCKGVVDGVYYFNMDWIFHNYGNALDVLLIKTDHDIHHVSVLSGSHVPGNTDSQMSLLFSTSKPGTVCFDVYLQDASGEICYYQVCVDFKEDECKEIKDCEYKYKATAKCLYQHSIGAYYYSFDIKIQIPNPGLYNTSLVPTYGPYNVLNYNTSVTGTNVLNITGDYVSYDGQTEPCFDIILTNSITGEICVFSKVCVKILEYCNNSLYRIGENALINESEINVFPNPTSGLLQIVGLKSALEENDIELSIHNYSGELVKTKRLKRDDFNLIDLRDLSEGLYLIKIHLNDQIVVKRIILAKQ